MVAAEESVDTDSFAAEPAVVVAAVDTTAAAEPVAVAAVDI